MGIRLSGASIRSGARGERGRNQRTAPTIRPAQRIALLDDLCSNVTGEIADLRVRGHRECAIARPRKVEQIRRRLRAEIVAAWALHAIERVHVLDPLGIILYSLPF